MKAPGKPQTDIGNGNAVAVNAGIPVLDIVFGLGETSRIADVAEKMIKIAISVGSAVHTAHGQVLSSS